MRRVAGVSIALVLMLFAGTACHRTRYVNLTPQIVEPTGEPRGQDRVRSHGWQNFFLFGWVPGNRLIRASEVCGGMEHVDRIETRKTFLQGLIELLTTGYLNVYSPYSGRVVCDHSPLQQRE